MIKKLKHFFHDKPFPLVLLFGSFAKNQTHTLSDVDIGVWMESFEEKIELSLELNEYLQRRVDIVNLNGLWERDAKFAYEIISHHKPIVVRDEELYVEFKTKTFLYYLDRKPLFDMFERAFLQRVEDGNIGKTHEIGRKHKNSSSNSE